MRKRPGISIVITAHNAENTICECLESIAANRGFDTEEIEIILVDDRSRDKTAAVARSLGLDNLVVIPIEKYEDRNLTARQAALDMGLREARGEIFLVTDADALVPADWIQDMTTPLRSTAKPYPGEDSSAKENDRGSKKKNILRHKSKSESCPGPGYSRAAHPDGTAGMIEFRGKKKWLAKLQSIDSICYFCLSLLLNRMGFSGGIFFGNFAFKREVFKKTGGFKTLGFALTEDLQFYRAMRDFGFPVHFTRSAPISVQATCGWKDLIQRTKRVSSGGFSLLSLGLGMWLVSFIILLILALGKTPVLLTLLAIRYLLGAGFAAYAVLGARRFSLLPLAFVYEISVIVLGIITLFAIKFKKKVEWGGVIYDR